MTTAIDTPKSAMMVPANTDFMTSKANDFPGTVEVARQLLPYYQTALRKIQPETSSTATRLTRSGNGIGTLPESLTREVRDHLTVLQASAFTVEANNPERAKEIREVAKELSGMLQITQHLGQEAQAVAHK